MNPANDYIPLLERPYRSCVGLMIFNKNGEVFCGQRIDNKAEAWQLPQGGIDEGETPLEAGFRELNTFVNTLIGSIMTSHCHLLTHFGMLNTEAKRKDGFSFIS